MTAARQEYKDGDEEVAFVFFRKFVALFEIMRKRPNYIQKKALIDEMLGSSYLSIVHEFLGLHFSLLQR